jgi:spore photoproduct lyase
VPLAKANRGNPSVEKRTVFDDYLLKFEKIKAQTLFESLDDDERKALREIAIDNRFTLQELKKFVESAIDLTMWNEKSLTSRWAQWHEMSELGGREFKKWAFNKITEFQREITEKEIEYTRNEDYDRAYRKQKLKVLEDTSGIKIFGKCPVYSEKTLCCNLYTIDAVKNCGFGCSYCSIQSMYTGDNILIDQRFGEKLDAIELDPTRRYHIGTGQSSDALMWGNTHGILDDMFRFARKWPNALVEFKTKSKNVDFFLSSDVPRNVVCSWSLNPDLIIQNEEHLTPSLPLRLSAAKSVVERGIKVGFHLHPMIIYKDWQKDYSALINELVREFHTDDVVFVSFGSLTFPKPVIQKIRRYGIKSKIHQMPMVPNPEGKLTYPDETKIRLFRHAHDAFGPWHDKVFFYLCMEEKKFWEPSLGDAFPDNEAFERSLLDSAWEKLNKSSC